MILIFRGIKMNKMILFILILVLQKSSYSRIKKDYKIRVRVAKKQEVIEILGTDLSRYIYPNNKKRFFPGRKKIKFNCQYFNKNKRLKNKQIKLASIASPTGLVTFNDKKYKGDLHIIANSLGNCDLVNEIEMDLYISTLLAKEMNSSWPMEALKAQAITARTYAIDKMINKNRGKLKFYDLENSEKHQVNGDFFDITRRTSFAALSTSGMVLKNKKGEIIPTFFHASCGGMTIVPHQAWNKKIKSYKSVKCDYCKNKNNWNYSISRKEFYNFLTWLKKERIIKVKKLSRSFRIYFDKVINQSIYLKMNKQKIVIKKSKFRNYFGRVKFPSNRFYIADGFSVGKVYFMGKGNGHGVGLCQIGTKRLAERKWSYRKILAYYFPGFEVKKIY